MEEDIWIDFYAFTTLAEKVLSVENTSGDKFFGDYWNGFVWMWA